ncbi:MAG: four-carbon acid sugar kinase family protein [Bryobacteraceae bacterium]
MRLLAIADDATGALEVGGQLAALGVRSLFTTGEAIDLDSEAVVVDAATRHLDAPLAYQTVARIAAAARRGGVTCLYKKTDSTLRGNIPSEFQALLDAFPERPLVYVPAYPKMGRVVRSGELLVDGVPLGQTAIARDPLNPVRDGSIPALLAGLSPSLAGTGDRLKSLLAAAAPRQVIICDGRSDDDLAAAASVIAGCGRPCTVAGTGGFVGYWAGALPLERRYTPPALRVSRCLVVSGSLHPASREQIRFAAASGLPTVYLPETEDGDVAPGSSPWSALATAGTSPNGVGEKMGALVRRAVEAGSADCLVIFGGDTTLAVLRSLGITVLENLGELLPGVPVSQARHRGSPLTLVTKAGGFGGPEMLISIKELLEKSQ